jgi:hypothetical protein
VRIVPAPDAVDPAEAFQDFVAAIGDLLVADWLEHNAPVLGKRNLIHVRDDARTRRANAKDAT